MAPPGSRQAKTVGQSQSVFRSGRGNDEKSIERRSSHVVHPFKYPERTVSIKCMMMLMIIININASGRKTAAGRARRRFIHLNKSRSTRTGSSHFPQQNIFKDKPKLPTVTSCTASRKQKHVNRRSIRTDQALRFLRVAVKLRRRPCWPLRQPFGYICS